MSELSSPRPAALPETMLAEQVLADAWCLVLGVAEVGPSDNFYDLDGDSLAVLKVIAALRQQGFLLRLSQLYDNPEFAAAAALVTPVETGADEALGTDPSPAPRRLPLLPVQARTLDYDRLRPNHHNDDAVYAVPAGVNTGDLIEALQILIDRHASLTTRFGSAGGQRFQEPGRPVDVRTLTEVIEVGPAEHDRIEAIGIAAHHSFDLETGQVFAARILTVEGTPWAVALVIHHLVCDLLSWHVLATDLARLLEDRRGGLPAATGYQDWVEFVAAQAADPARFGEHLDYWRSRPWPAVTGLRRLTDRPDRRLGTLRNLRSGVEVGEPATFRRAAAELGADAIVLGALNYALHTVHGARTTVIDTVVNGRDQLPGAPDVSRTVGYFAEFAPVVTDLGPATGPVAVVQATAAQFRATPAPRIAFGMLRNLSSEESLRAELQALPAADLYVNYRGSLLAAGDSALPELDYSLGPFQSPQEQQGYPIRIMVDLAGGTLTSLWKFSADELDETEVQAMVDAFEHAVVAVCRQWAPVAAGRHR